MSVTRNARRFAVAGLTSAAFWLATPHAFAQVQASTTTSLSSDGGFLGRFFQAYLDELNPPAPTAAPAGDALLTRRPAPFPPAPVSSPPYPFTDWPFGGASTIGASVPNQVDSPLMKALAPTRIGNFLQDAGIQIYGWVEGGANLSSNHAAKGGNSPAAYDYNPNTVQLDQAALYVERVPDTVQKDHLDWGFRITGIYGVDYRYTTAFGLGSEQLLKHNNQNGWDIPMAYGEVYVPWVAQGMVIRAGRYISVPDIEAQLATNNYMYTHSMTYTFDNYTNTGVLASVQLTKNWMVQAGVSAGTETLPWHTGNGDPGRQPSFTGCVRWNSDSSNDSVYVCANGINNGKWGYNNLQQYVFTYYHKFNDRLHLDWETWQMHENDVPNVNVTGGSYAGTPFMGLRNAPNQAYCHTGTRCTASEWATLAYLNYRLSDTDSLSVRAEYFDDQNGQRTGYRTAYANAAVGWQHFFSPSILVRPELDFYHALSATPFDLGRRRSSVIGAVDLVVRF